MKIPEKTIVFILTFKILRFEPQKDEYPHSQIFRHEPQPQDSVLEALKDIRDQQDPSLSFRYSACPVAARDGRYAGPAALTKLCRFAIDPRDRRPFSALERVDGPDDV